MKLPKLYSDEWGLIEWIELTLALIVMITVLLVFIEELYVPCQ